MAERGFRQKPYYQRVSSKAAGLQRLLAVLWRLNLCRRNPPLPSWGPPACRGWSGGHPSSWWVSPACPGRGGRKSWSRSQAGRTWGRRVHEGLARVLLREQGGPTASGVWPPRPVLHGRPGRARGHSAGSAGPMELGAPPAGRWPTLQSRLVLVVGEARREVGAAGQRRHVGRAAVAPPPAGISLRNLGAHGWPATRSWALQMELAGAGGRGQLSGWFQGCHWKNGWRVGGGWRKGRPWACSVWAPWKERHIRSVPSALRLSVSRTMILLVISSQFVPSSTISLWYP